MPAPDRGRGGVIPAKVISVINQKGGVGKTTIAVHLAAALTLQQKRVLLVDADPQGSALDWAADRQEKGRKLLFPVIGLPKRILHTEIPKISEGYDAVVIDGPPRIYDVARSAIQASSVALVPVQPSQYDVWAAEETVSLLQECLELFSAQLKAAFVINRRIANTAVSRGVSKILADYPIPVLKSTICQRVAFAESTRGLTVHELDAKSAASQEINQLVKEVSKFTP